MTNSKKQFKCMICGDKVEVVNAVGVVSDQGDYVIINVECPTCAHSLEQRITIPTEAVKEYDLTGYDRYLNLTL